MPDRSWMHQAACRGMDTEIWFADSEAAHSIAKGVCRRCPVAETCLRYALDIQGTWGIWGGTTRPQRTRLTESPGKCRNGHPRTPENTYIKPSTGQRQCRVCMRDAEARWRQKARAAA